MNQQSPASSELTEYARPWKLATLAIGIALLLVGSVYFKAVD